MASLYAWPGTVSTMTSLPRRLLRIGGSSAVQLAGEARAVKGCDASPEVTAASAQRATAMSVTVSSPPSAQRDL
jgi:hypothetical protein